MSKKNTNILVIKLSALGDFFIALGSMKAIRTSHPDAHITLLTTATFKNLAEQSGYFDTVLIDDRPKWFELLKFYRIYRTLTRKTYDLVFDLQNNDRSRLYKLCFSQTRTQWFGVDRQEKKAHMGHAFDLEVDILKRSGIDDVGSDDLSWMISDIDHLDLPQSYVLLVPGCAPQHPYKKWPQTHYASLAKQFADNGVTAVIIGGPDEVDIAQFIAFECAEAINLVGRTKLHDIPSIARGAIGAIGNDTGPMHIIAMTHCPSLVLFSAYSDPVKSKPIGQHVYTLRADHLYDLRTKDVWDALPFDISLDTVPS